MYQSHGWYGVSFFEKPVQSVTSWRTPPEHGFPRLGPNAALKQRQHFRRLKSKGRQVSNASITQVPSASALDVIFTHNFSSTFQRFALLSLAHVGRSEGSASWSEKLCLKLGLDLANRTQTQPPCRIAELLLLLFNSSHLVNILIHHRPKAGCNFQRRLHAEQRHWIHQTGSLIKDGRGTRI